MLQSFNVTGIAKQNYSKNKTGGGGGGGGTSLRVKDQWPHDLHDSDYNFET